MTEKSIEKAQFDGIIKEDKVIISDSEGIDEFFRNSYIGNLEQTEEGQETLVLDPIEVLLLIERNRLLIWENNNKNQEQFNFEKLLEYFIHYDNRLWHKYVIYMDLRKRGYIVRPGYGEGIEFLVFKRGANFEEDAAKFLIYPVYEGTPIELRDLDKISRVAMSSRKDLIVATVDRLSKTIYYSVKKFQLLNKEKESDQDNVL